MHGLGLTKVKLKIQSNESFVPDVVSVSRNSKRELIVLWTRQEESIKKKQIVITGVTKTLITLASEIRGTRKAITEGERQRLRRRSLVSLATGPAPSLLFHMKRPGASLSLPPR